MQVTRLAVQRPLLVLAFYAFLALGGALGYARLGVDLMPRLELPVVTVVVAYPGAGPEDVEDQVTRHLEDALFRASGIRHVSSVSSENVSTVVAEFRDGVDPGEAAAEVQRRVAEVRGELPAEAEEPVIVKADVNALPVLEIAVAGDLPPSDLYRLADDVVRPQLEGLSGVASVTVIGGRREEIQVQFDPDRLWAYGVTVQDLAGALRAGNLRLPAGAVERGERRQLLRYDAEAERPEQLLDVPVRVGPDGREVRVGDVAAVVETFAEQRQLYRLNGREAVGIAVTKQSEANTVAVAAAVKEVLRRLGPSLPAGVELVVAADQSLFIRDSVLDVQRELGLAVLVTGLVLLVFLHTLRSTFIALCAIPVSLVVTLGFMEVAGFSLNIVTLLALAMTVGILVDDAVVVLENIVHHLRQGKDPRRAAVDGRSEIGLAAIAITLADVVVFVPVAFTTGLVGSVFRQFGLTVAAATLTSLLVSFTLTPLLASRWLRPDVGAGRWARAWDGLYDRLEGRYAAALAWALRHRPAAAAVVAAAAAAGLAVLPLGWLQQEFVPEVDQNEFNVYVELPPGASLAATGQVLEDIEGFLARQPEVVRFAASAGVSGGLSHALLEQSQGQARFGTVRVVLADRGQRRASAAEVADRVRRFGATLPGVAVRVQLPVVGLATAQPLAFRVEGPDPAGVARLSQELADVLRQTPGVVDVTETASAGTPELRFRPDRLRAARLGVPQVAAAEALRLAYDGEVVTTFSHGPAADGTLAGASTAERDVRLIAAPAFRRQDRFADLPVASAGTGLIRLGDITSVQADAAPGDIRRYDRLYQSTVSANLLGRDLGSATAEVLARARALAIPPGYRLVPASQAQEMGTSFRALATAAAVSVFLLYLLLVALYDSLLLPFVTLFTVPLAATGALAALAAAGQSLNVLSFIGLILLVGLAGKNGILLVDLTRTLHRPGSDRDAVLVQAGRRRLRPILMTSASVALAMLPIVLGLGSGSELRRPMAVAVAGGVVSSTLLTLFAVPMVYAWLDDLRVGWGRLRQAAVHLRSGEGWPAALRRFGL